MLNMYVCACAQIQVQKTLMPLRACFIDVHLVEMFPLFKEVQLQLIYVHVHCNIAQIIPYPLPQHFNYNVIF